MENINAPVQSQGSDPEQEITKGMFLASVRLWNACPPISDMKPSQLLRKMKSLAGVNISEKVLRTLWLDKLPDSIKNILVISSENLSVMADKIFEINSSPEIYSAMKNILDKVSLLEQRNSELSINRRNSRSEFKNSNQTRYKSRSRDLVSVPTQMENTVVSTSCLLYAANGSKIPTFGHKILTLNLGLRREFQFPFNIAKVDLMKPNLLLTNTKHDVKHLIATKGPSVYSKTRQLDSKKLEIAKQEFTFMLDNDIIRPSKSPWTSPLHLVNIKDGSVRPCSDYRRLNAQTISDRYPIPRIENFHHILKGNRIFSKIDLFKAYFQIPISEEDKEKIAILTPFGLFEFNVMSFGLRNAPSTFQHFINEVLFGLEFVFPFLDDILVASKNEEQHKTHLKLVFDRLQKYGLRVNISKSTLGVTHLEFLGYLITSEGSKPLSEKVDAILSYKLPETIHDLRAFLGLPNFYRRHLKNAAKHQAIHHEYLKGSKMNDKVDVVWTEETIENFEKCKQDLEHATLLSFPEPNLQLALFTDASNFAIGTVLQQFESGSWKPISFFSTKLTEAQKNYSTYDRELLGIYLSIKQFKHLLEGRNFIIYTDHKPITYVFHQKNEKAAPRQIESISEIDYDKIADAQVDNEELNKLRLKPSSNFKQYPLDSGKLLWCDTSSANIRPFISQPLRMHMFQKIHNSAHPGVKSTVKQIASRFI
ncbi:hypothetical protein TNCV_3721451 [Trichonephila clavipes]|nr:hypothetical protein TNCV_3721451 [Trichonephila clavipes]